MNNPKFPKFDSPEVKAIEQFIIENSKADNRLNNFHREYFKNSLTRISMSAVFMFQLMKPDSAYLDVGSFGIIPLLVKNKFPNAMVDCLSFEGNRVGINENGFYESYDPQDSTCILIKQVDVEQNEFPYPDHTFDFVTCFEVIEHLKFSPIPMMKEIKRVLKPQGKLILSTPNINSSKSLLKILCGESPQECPYYHNNFNYGVIHPKEYTIEEMRELFYCMGFSSNDIYTIHTSRVTPEEEIIIASIPNIIEKVKKISERQIFPNHFGDKIVAIGSNDEKILSETPPKLYS